MYPTVTNFLGFFSDTLDQAALVTFNTLATTNVPMIAPFTSTISSSTHVVYVTGPYPTQLPTDPNTFTDGERGLYDALNIEAPINASNFVKAVIFFTDGHMNTLEDTLNCPGSTNLVFTAGDGSQTEIDFFYKYPVALPFAGSATNIGCKVCGGKDPCSASTSFPSLHGGGGTLSFTADNVREEAEDRCIEWASEMRDNKIVVCAVGLGTGSDRPDVPFMQIVANDPAYPGLTPTPYDGIYVTATNSTDMLPAFQTIAETLLLRLIH